MHDFDGGLFPKSNPSGILRVLKSSRGGETANRPRFSAIECPFLSITNKINFTLIRHGHTIGAPVRPNEEI